MIHQELMYKEVNGICKVWNSDSFKAYTENAMQISKSYYEPNFYIKS